MASTLRELELLSSLLALLSTLPASRPLYRAAALEIFHLVTGLFLTIYVSHIPCDFHYVSHSTPTSFLFDFLFHFYQPLWSSTLQHLSPHRYIKIGIISKTSLIGGMVVVISTSHRRSPGSILWSSQPNIFILSQPR